MNLNEYIQQNGKRLKYEKGERLFSQGEVCKQLYFFEKGLSKVFYLTPDGREFIKSFISENALISSLRSLMLKEESSFSVECIEPSNVVQLDMPTLLAYASDDLEMSNALNEVLLQLAMKKERREYDFLCLSAAERGFWSAGHPICIMQAGTGPQKCETPLPGQPATVSGVWQRIDRDVVAQDYPIAGMAAVSLPGK